MVVRTGSTFRFEAAQYALISLRGAEGIFPQEAPLPVPPSPAQQLAHVLRPIPPALCSFSGPVFSLSCPMKTAHIFFPVQLHPFSIVPCFGAPEEVSFIMKVGPTPDLDVCFQPSPLVLTSPRPSSPAYGRGVVLHLATAPVGLAQCGGGLPAIEPAWRSLPLHTRP